MQNPRKITFEQAMDYLNAPETFATGQVVVQYRTADTFGFKGATVHSTIDSVEKSTDPDDDTTWLTIHGGFATIADFDVIAYFLIEPTAEQVANRIRLSGACRKQAWEPTELEVTEIISEQIKTNESIGIRAS